MAVNSSQPTVYCDIIIFVSFSDHDYDNDDCVWRSRRSIKAVAVVGTPSPVDKKDPPMSKNQAKKARMLSAKKERRKSSVQKARETVASVNVAAAPHPHSHIGR